MQNFGRVWMGRMVCYGSSLPYDPRASRPSVSAVPRKRPKFSPGALREVPRRPQYLVGTVVSCSC
jgi:hypothetical protein